MAFIHASQLGNLSVAGAWVAAGKDMATAGAGVGDVATGVNATVISGLWDASTGLGVALAVAWLVRGVEACTMAGTFGVVITRIVRAGVADEVVDGAATAVAVAVAVRAGAGWATGAADATASARTVVGAASYSCSPCGTFIATCVMGAMTSTLPGSGGCDAITVLAVGLAGGAVAAAGRSAAMAEALVVSVAGEAVDGVSATAAMLGSRPRAVSHCATAPRRCVKATVLLGSSRTAVFNVATAAWALPGCSICT